MTKNEANALLYRVIGCINSDESLLPIAVESRRRRSRDALAEAWSVASDGWSMRYFVELVTGTWPPGLDCLRCPVTPGLNPCPACARLVREAYPTFTLLDAIETQRRRR